jgi:hypothetical protein
VINKGNNDAECLPREDKDGKCRVLDGIVDMGAYEYSGNLIPPTAHTGEASSITERSATLKGTLNPNGFDTRYHFEFGTTTAYGQVSPTINAGSGSASLSPANIRVRLWPNTTYHYRLSATNGCQTVYGVDRTFTTLPLPPSATTMPATAVNAAEPTLNGKLNPNGKSSTYYFEYGTTTALGSVTSTKSAGSGTNELDVFDAITGVSQNTLYHYRLVAQNNSGISYGADQTFTTAISLGNTLHVPKEYPSIQDALNAANEGDTVLVADGTYKGMGNKNLTFKGKSITLKSENGPENCIIDCEGEGRGLSFGSDDGPNTEVSGFTITNGYASNGGGIHICNSSSTVSNCLITNNTATGFNGGGIYADGSECDCRITNCTIANNKAYNYGGGLFSEATGGMVTVTHCTITNNVAHIFGGGIYCDYKSDANFVDCTISDNIAVYGGGGIYYYYAYVHFNRCLIQRNKAVNAGSWGGGIHFESYRDYGDTNTFTNCIVTGNAAGYGGGFYLLFASPIITNCTVIGNLAYSDGGGVTFCEDSSPNIWNSIFWENTPDELYVYSGAPEIHYTNIEGGYSGTGNIDSDPLFVGNGDYHLTSNPIVSPSINTGVDYAPGLPSADKDENARIIDGRPDMGSYEYEKLSPSATTIAATDLTGTSAVIRGSVNPRGAQTQFYFQYGTTNAYGYISPYIVAGAETESIPVNCLLSGLRSATTYHYRVVAKNENFTVYGNDLTFTTGFTSVVYVNKDDNTCGGNDPCYTTIQTAINGASSGSAIKVTGGTYTEIFTLNQAKMLTLQGGWNSAFTTQKPGSTIIKAPKASQGSLTLQNVLVKP